ncbi:21S rRNA GM methyltransferase [Sarotherodon galilaeus]
MNEEEEDTVAEMEARAVKITPKAMGERLQRVVNLRKAKLAKLTGTVKQVRQLMENECDASLTEATQLMKDFNERFGEFCGLNTNVKEVLQQMPEEDLTKDQEKWFEPKADSFKAFAETASAWIDKMAMRAVEAEKCNEDLDPSDSISNASVSKRSDKAFSERGSCASSSVSSTRMKAEVERATLLIKASSLRQKRLLEEREAKLQAEKEELEIQTALAANEAKIKILSEYESRASKASSRVSTRDGMNSYMASHRVGNLFTSQQSNSPSPTRERQAQKKNILQNAQQTHTVTSQLPQTPSALQDVVEVLTKQQKLATLPPQNISVFKGDPLEYRLFMRAFEHGVEDRTESDKDRLYYMEQYTSGQPRELIRSCLHMEPTHGYQTAKRLLEEHFGNAYKISVAYIHKALNWPTIKSDDGEALHAFGLYLTGCHNAMMDVEYMEELDNTANMRAIVSKLPYKLRERWRTFACGVLDKEKRRVKFADLAEFVNKQAKEVLHPLFGDIKDSTLKVQVRGQVDERLQRRSGIRKGFTTAATITTTQDVPSKERKKVSGNQVCAFSKPCLFCCGEEHTMEQCKRMRKSLHKEKIDFMRTKGLCLGCLKQGHMSSSCKEKASCQVCAQLHPTVLHMKTKPSATSKRAASEVESLEREDQTESIVNGFVEMEAPAHDAEKTEHILAIVPVQVKPKRGQKVTHTYAFLDPGSTACFCTEELMHELNLTGRKTNILLKTMGEEKVVSSHIVSGLEISSLDSDDFFELPEMYSHSDIPASADNAPSQDYIGLLIGANAPKAVEPWQVIASENGGPYAVKTRLGWTISEPLQGSSSQRAACGLIQVAANRISVSKLDELWDQQFKSDFPECERNEKQEMSREDLQFLEIATESATIVDGHYSIALPLRNKRIKMPNNRKVAEQCALHLKRKLERNTPFHTEYSAFMSNIITKVYHPKKHKLRVVFDCGASYKGTTLNDQLLQGPNLTSTLLGVIIRFRQEEVAIMADVEAMFHQVKVPDEDSDLLRFLWWTSGDITQKMVEYKMVVHIFGATSSPSCASFALRKCAEDNRDPANSQAVDTVLHNFYVDDCLKAVSSEEEAIQLYHTLRAVCQRGGFRLTKWISNSRAVLSAIPEEERASEVKDFDLDQDTLPIERALGVQWCIESDSFRFKIVMPDRAPTWRNLLSIVSSVYDPLGILSPVTLQAKKILQELCRRKVGWDVIIPADLAHRWLKWKTQLHQLENISVPRCFKPVGFGESVYNQLQHFADASEEGYGTVSYLLQRNSRNEVYCAFMLGKARVAPLKPITVPRMELSAATMAARMDRVLAFELQLPLQPSVFWSDSTTVLKYISNQTSRFRTFVANRVDAVLKCSSPEQWSFMQSHTWLQGPDFLTKPMEEWPEEVHPVEGLTIDDPEVKGNLVCASTIKECEDVVLEFLQYFSSWFKLKRAVAWMLKVKSILLQLCRKRKELSAVKAQPEVERDMKGFKDSLFQGDTNKLTVENLAKAEEAIICYCQRRTFSKEITALSKGQGVKRTSSLFKLSPVLEQGILRESKRPAILNKDLHVTKLILREIHENLAHCGRNHVISKLRTKFWVPSANAAVRKILARCIACRRAHGVAGQQQMADLPRDRVLPDDPPFTNCGVDYFGPYEIKRERLIKSVKKILNVTLRLQTLDEESLHTLLCEAEAIINSRPITKASSDPNDVEVLTPNHLLLLRNKPSLPPGLFDRQDLYARRRWKQVQYMSEIFWKRWAREYLPQLQERQRWTRPSRNFLVGDIVLIVDDTAPRNSWITGKVIHTISDKAGMVRQVRIKTKTSVLDRPITKICLLQESD